MAPPLGNVDLNLLIALDALLHEGTVTRAAARVGLTQSAMSHALNRLRAHFEDPLLVRRGANMTATPLAERLAAPLAEALTAVDGVLATRSRFDPATAVRRFGIVASDYAQIVIVLPLLRVLRESSPGIDLRVRAVAHPEHALAERGFELMVGPMRDDLPSLRRQRLLVDRLVCVGRRKHPAFEGGLTIDRYLAAQHVLVSPRGLLGGLVDDALARRGLERRVALDVPHFLVAPFAVAESDLLLTVPSLLAESVARRVPLDIAPLPLELPAIEFAQAWHSRHQNDAGHAWLRAAVAEVASTQRPQ